MEAERTLQPWALYQWKSIRVFTVLDGGRAYVTAMDSISLKIIYTILDGGIAYSYELYANGNDL